MEGPGASWHETMKILSPTTVVRRIVSKAKRRYQQEGFDLDLAYITDRIVAMGVPCQGPEAVYRNPMSQVIKLLRKKHCDPETLRPHYMVYNLCSEYVYDPKHFENNVKRFPFDDHQVAPLELMIEFCKDCSAWLDSDPKNVVVVHCKAGKGRTGLMISALLLYIGICESPEEALRVFGERRTEDGHGVTISSQQRYVEYFHRVMRTHGGDMPAAKGVVLRSIRLAGLPVLGRSKKSEKYTVVIWIKHGDGTASIAMLEPRGEEEEAAGKQQQHQQHPHGVVREERSGSVSLLTISGKGGWHCTEVHRSTSAVMEDGSPLKLLPPRSKSTPEPMRKGMSVRLLERSDEDDEEEEKDAGEEELNRVMSPQWDTKLNGASGGGGRGRGSPSDEATAESNGTRRTAAEAEVNNKGEGCQRSSRSSSGRLVGNLFGGIRRRGGSSGNKMKLTDSTDSGGVRFVPCTLSCNGVGEDGGSSLPVHVWADFAPLILLQDNVKIQVFRTSNGKNKSVGYTWLNTVFLPPDGCLRLSTGQIDQQKIKPMSFELRCEELPEEATLSRQPTRPEELFGGSSSVTTEHENGTQSDHHVDEEALPGLPPQRNGTSRWLLVQAMAKLSSLRSPQKPPSPTAVKAAAVAAGSHHEGVGGGALETEQEPLSKGRSLLLCAEELQQDGSLRAPSRSVSSWFHFWDGRADAKVTAHAAAT